MVRMKRAYRGLYGNRMIQFGNKISFAENKTRRTWKPNVQKKTMYSETLQRTLTFRMTTYVMRCIRKVGGIDEYLLKTRESEIKYPRALEIKQEIIEVRREQKRLATEGEDKEPGTSEEGPAEISSEGQGQKQQINGKGPSPFRSSGLAKREFGGLLQVLDF